MRTRYQDRAAKTAIILALSNLASTPVYWIFGRGAGFIFSCASNFLLVNHFHSTGAGIEGRAFGSMRDRIGNFFTHDQLSRLENAAKNVVTGGEVEFDRIVNTISRNR